MKFGQVENPEEVDFSLPEDHPETGKVLSAHKSNRDEFNVFVGCAKWNRKDLKKFYPRGTRDELEYYSTQFNSIELNATFYGQPTREQVITWKDKTPDGFKFFPKITNSISHFKRLNNVKIPTEEYCDIISAFEEKLGMVFLQMHNNFKPKFFDRVETFLNDFPSGIPLAVEVRSEEWFSDKEAESKYNELLEKNGVTNILVDTAGRRDLLHMRLTTPTAFIRYVGANHHSDKDRLDEWIERIKKWRAEGLENLYFFVHQNIEKESPLLSAYFINKLNKEFELNLKVPELPDGTAK